mgnify:CR=1 FL=1
MAKIKGLGRGLDALLAQEEKATKEDQSLELPVVSLQPGRHQPRTLMDDETIKSLSISIKSQGVIQPILVRSISTDKYEIIAGERRWRASQMAGLDTVPVIVRNVPDESAMSMALIENMQREDLNPLEEAEGINRLVKEFGLTHELVAKSLGKSRSAISNLLRLLLLDQEVQKLLKNRSIDMGHARALLSLEKPTQLEVARRIVTLRLSVRETEQLVNSGVKSKGHTRQPIATKTRDVKRLEEELGALLSATVDIQHKKTGIGKLIIQYGTLDQLENVVSKLRK